MLSTSFEFRRKIAENSKVLAKADLTLADGTKRTLVGDDLMLGGMTFSDAVSSGGSFDIGAAIMNKLTLTLNNYDRRFDEYDFTDATVVPYVGVELDSGEVEWLRKGVYGIDQPESYGSTIGLSSLDNMRKLERPYSDVGTVYPASLRTIVTDICRVCGVTLADTDFPNNGFSVAERPDDDALTCVAVLSFAAQASGNWARFNEWGNLVLEWFQTDVFEGEDWLDGDRFDDDTPYSSGSDAEGGNFIDYSSGDAVEGGEFGTQRMVNVWAISSATIFTDDVVVTGVKVTAQDEEVEDGDDLEGETVLYGSEGYVLEIPDNPLVQYGRASEVASQVGARVVGMRFRPFDLSAVGNPAVEAGDAIVITDRLQNQYTSYITTTTYKVGAYQTYACNAESPGRNRASSYSAVTRAIVQQRNAIKQERADREQAVTELATRLAESSGLYMTTQRQADGSYIYYMHDKPTLRESRVVWKLTANAFGISTDGGATYPYGLDVSGNAILNRVYAIGLDADYIRTGALVVKRYGATVFSADVDTGIVTMNADCVTIGSESLTTAMNGVRALYGTCTTGAATATKTVTCSGFTLRTGAVVNVRFTYKNTASNPKLNVNGTGAKAIYINNAVMTNPYFWDAQDVVTFVYSGSYWYVADSGALSKIKVTADSISLSVSNGSLGNKASIVLSVNGETQTKTIDMSGVRNAFKNDTTAITISAGTVTFNSNTFVVNSTYFKVSSTGVITATSGSIASFTIASGKLYSGKSSLTSNTYGVYVGTDGIAVGSGSAYTALAGGYLRGGNSDNITGYVGFNNYWTPTKVYGTRLAGRGCIALLTNGPFGIGSYYDYGADATITVGQSKSVTYVESLNTPKVSVTVSPSSITFNKTLYFPTGMNSDGTASSWSYVYVDKLLTGVSVSVNVGVTGNSKTIAFTKGLMTTS